MKRKGSKCGGRKDEGGRWSVAVVGGGGKRGRRKWIVEVFSNEREREYKGTKRVKTGSRRETKNEKYDI